MQAMRVMRIMRAMQATVKMSRIFVNCYIYIYLLHLLFEVQIHRKTWHQGNRFKLMKSCNLLTILDANTKSFPGSTVLFCPD